MSSLKWRVSELESAYYIWVFLTLEHSLTKRLRLCVCTPFHIFLEKINKDEIS
jgi:hypothetical protein